MGKAIVITSGKGGVGKSTAAVNIGTCLARSGRKVVIIDTDLGLRNLDVIMGLENMIVYNLVDVVKGSCRMKDALINSTFCPDLYLLPAAQTKNKSAVLTSSMYSLILDLKKEFDYVIIDCPAGIDQGFENAITGADMGIVIATSDITSIRAADRVIGLLQAHGIRDNHLILNRLRSDLMHNDKMMSVEDITEILAIDLLGLIPEDDSVIVSTNQGKPVSDLPSPAGTAYKNICCRLEGEDKPFPDFTRQESIFSKLTTMFHRTK